MAEQENVQVVRDAFEAWNAHDPKRYVALLHPEFVAESDTLPGPVRGPEAQRQVMEIYLHAFPDLHFAIEQMLASGEYVISRWHSTGTHRGELMGIAPTNKRGEGIRGCTVVQLKSSKIVREWVYWDTGTLMKQLGILPGPAQPMTAR